MRRALTRFEVIHVLSRLVMSTHGNYCREENFVKESDYICSLVANLETMSFASVILLSPR